MVKPKIVIIFLKKEYLISQYNENLGKKNNSKKVYI